jgi:hypothetical protein
VIDRADSICPVCGARQPADRGDRAGGTSRRRQPWWVPAGIAAGAVAVVLGGALLALVLNGDPESGLAGGSVAPSASSADASDTPAPSADTSAGESPRSSAAPTPTPEVAAVIPNRGIAEVVTDELNLRAAADRSSDIVAVLKEGQRLFIIGEPSQAGELRWYRVAVVNDPTLCAESCGLIGFAATSLAEDDSWITKYELECPTSPMTAEALAVLQPLEALSCYGRDEIAVTGTMEQPMHGAYSPYRYRPAWMRPMASTIMRHAWWVPFVAPPESGLADPGHGTIVRATGHFEDPTAVDCNATVEPAFFGGEVPDDFPIIERARVVLDCRATFVWTGYEVLGTEVVPTPTAGPVPDNDQPSGAIALNLDDRYEVDTTGAATEPEAPCENEHDDVSYPIAKTIWISFTGTGGWVTVDTRDTDFDTVAGIYREDGDGNLMVINCIDDTHVLQAIVEVQTEEGVRYLAQVGGFSGQSGQLVIRLYED